MAPTAGLRELSREDKVNIEQIKNQQMNSIQKLSGVVAMLCLGAAAVQAAGHVYTLNNLASGNWNSANVRTANTYQIGHSTELPNEAGAYFEYDLTPAKGKTVTGCKLLLIGSTDYSIHSYWANPDEGFTNHIQFKVGVAPQSNSSHPFTVAGTAFKVELAKRTLVRALQTVTGIEP